MHRSAQRRNSSTSSLVQARSPARRGRALHGFGGRGALVFFIFLVLGLIARVHGFSVWKFIKYIKEELLIVLGTSSSESMLPRMTEKIENLGANKTTVGLVIPTGYPFNLNGTSICLTMTAVFIAQAINTPTLPQELTLLAVLLLISKGRRVSLEAASLCWQRPCRRQVPSRWQDWL
jgi:hypothetical protein